MRRGVLIMVVSVIGLIATAVSPATAVQIAQDAVVRVKPASFTPHLLDGEVDAIARVGQTVVVGGTFTQAQNAGGGATLARKSLMAFDQTTGAINTSFVPTLDGTVYGLAAGPSGTVYVAGNFNNVNGTASYKLVQLRVSDGSRVTTFNPKVINAVVHDVRYTAGRLFIGGEFVTVAGQSRQRLAELNPTTGALLPSLNIPVTGTHYGGTTQVYHMDVSPDGTKLAIIGNFTSVGGLERTEAAMIDLSTPTATVSNWQTDRYKPQCYGVFKFITRDVEFSPDGSYFVIGTTGGFGPGSPSLCDTVTRWESRATGSALDPTWIDYSGGDSTYSVAPTGAAVYVGGHQRWWNNPAAADSAGPGAVERTGIAALDPVNGLPLAWNPGRKRGQGVFDMLATEDGLFIGSDTDTVNGDYHGRLAFFPLVGGAPVPQPTAPTLPVDVYSVGPNGAPNGPVLYRVNTGGPTISSSDAGPDWQGDTDTDSPLRNSGSNSAGWGQVGSVDSTVPASTPSAVFNSERWDPGSAPEMQWDFAAPVGHHLQVRLYLTNQCSCTSSPGQRAFNVNLDGQPVLTNYDIVADVGDEVGTMKSYDITSDGDVDIDFGHVNENPLINAIEIVDLDAPPAPSPNVAVRHEFDGTAVGPAAALPDSGIAWSQARGSVLLDGSLYTAWADGHFDKRSFDGTSFGPAQTVDLHGLTQFSNDMQQMTGMFYDNGRLYYTESGSSTLFMRYFTTGSDVVGAGLRDLQPFSVTGNVAGVDWSQVRGMFLAGGHLYWSDRTDGTLHAIEWAAGAPVAGTGSVVSGPSIDGVDWRYRAMFARHTVPNAAPTARITSSCSRLACTFSGATSGDSDGAIASYGWDFGDGQTDTGPTVQHTFGGAASYQVTLTVTDDDGAVDQRTEQVSVTDASPISFVAAVGDNQSGSVKNHTVVVPSTVQAGDAMVLAFSDNAPGTPITAPPGWQQALSQSTSGMVTRIWTRVATAADAGSLVRVSTDAFARGDLSLLTYRGTSTTDPVQTSAAAAETVSRTQHTTPSVTVTTAGSWVVSYWADKSAATTGWSVPAAQTVRHTFAGSGAGHISHVAADAGQVGTGSAGGVTASTDSATAQAVMATLVLTPAG